MKTPEQIQRHIDAYIKQMKYTVKNGDLIKKEDAYLANLKRFKLYLETSPREEFIVNQLKETQKRIEFINTHENYREWCLSNPAKIKGMLPMQRKRAYEVAMELPKHMRRQHALEFILDDELVKM